MTTHTKINEKCLEIEQIVSQLVLMGITDNRMLVETIDEIYHPENNKEIERYSEAIIYAKFAILN